MTVIEVLQIKYKTIFLYFFWTLPKAVINFSSIPSICFKYNHNLNPSVGNIF